ncbi:DEAD/DEAH box helicase [Candidatus Woesearchaeota archaeon]|nr:DEAD/DEAH box helicase [Candidatus Woesearchaeota archaeon]
MDLNNLKLNSNLIKAIKEMGYTEFTEIQNKCIPAILEGKDIFGQSKTGSGKTAAFGLPILQKIKPGEGLQVLILTPTRELCVQVTQVLNNFGKYSKIKAVSIYGGVGIEPQIRDIKKADIVIGTPGRIQDHLGRKTISFQNIKYLVLDEADRMFDIGFINVVERIIAHTPKEKQTLLFSATLSESVNHILKKHLKNPIIIKSSEYVEPEKLKQIYYSLEYYEKFSLLVHLLKKETFGIALVFCATRREVDLLTRNLRKQGIKVMGIHGGLTQNRRQQALNQLKSENIRVLVATDVAARGLDIPNITHVYNYDVPKTSDEYIHRIGRTARAGEMGEAITLLIEKDYSNFDNVLSNRRIQIKKEEVPKFKKVYFERNMERRRPFQRVSFPGKKYGQREEKRYHYRR